jgi:PBP1b-binding outer membrane lipoprotein LpoB
MDRTPLVGGIVSLLMLAACSAGSPAAEESTAPAPETTRQQEAASAAPSESPNVLVLKDLEPGMYEATIEAPNYDQCWVTVTEAGGSVVMEKMMYESIWFRAFDGATVTLEGDCPTLEDLERTSD